MWHRFRGVVLVVVVGAAAFSVFLITAWILLRRATGSQLPEGPAVESLLSITDTLSIWMGLLSVMIALASLVVTGVGLAVGALAIFGYQTFREEVTKRVSEATVQEMNKFFGGTTFADTLAGQVKQHLSTQGIKTESTSLPPTLGAVKRYPGKKRVKRDGDIGTDRSKTD